MVFRSVLAVEASVKSPVETNGVFNCYSKVDRDEVGRSGNRRREED